MGLRAAIRRLALGFLAAQIVVLAFATPVMAATPTWSSGPDMPFAPGHYATATSLADGRVLVAGGFGPHNLSAVFDPATNTWSPVKFMNAVRAIHAAVRLLDGRVLVIGGFNGSSADNSVETYDPATDAWTLVAPMHVPRYYHVAGLLDDGRVLAAGGYSGSYEASAEIYDPIANTWTMVASMTTARVIAVANVLSNGRMLVSGGLSLSGLPNSAEVYDPMANTWTLTLPMAAGRREHRSTTLADGRVLVTGGLGTSNSFLASAEVFDRDTNAWSSVPDMSTGRWVHGSSLRPDGRVLVTGGEGGPNTFELFDPATNAWSTADVMGFTRYHTSTSIPGGRVLIAGGLGIGNPLATQVYGAENVPPIADAGPDQMLGGAAGLFTPVTLDGSGSSDADLDSLFYVWKEGATTVASTSGAVQTAHVTFGPGTHNLTLTVSDGAGGMASDMVTIEITDELAAAQAQTATVQSLLDEVTAPVPQINAVIPPLITLIGATSPGPARTSLLSALTFLPVARALCVAGSLQSCLNSVRSATSALASAQAGGVNTTAMQLLLAQGAGIRAARGRADMSALVGASHAKVVLAGTYLAQGNAFMTAGNYPAAIGSFLQVFSTLLSAAQSAVP